MEQNKDFLAAMNAISNQLKNADETEAQNLIDKTLAAHEITGVKQSRTEKQNGPYCPDGYEYRTCYWVEHGDGTKSDEWCTTWGCATKTAIWLGVSSILNALEK